MRMTRRVSGLKLAGEKNHTCSQRHECVGLWLEEFARERHLEALFDYHIGL